MAKALSNNDQAPHWWRAGSSAITVQAIGTSRRRREDAALVTGQGRYVGDLAPRCCLHAAFLRSPHARARIVTMDPSPAMALPGTVAVFTAAQFAAMPPHPVNAVLEAPQLPHAPVLAAKHVSAAGQPLAVVVARSAAQALDAIEAIEVSFESATPVLEAEDARKASSLNTAMSDNLVAAGTFSAGDIAAAFEAADVVVEATSAHSRLFPASLEGRAMLADWDHVAERLVVHSSIQTPHRTREDLARMLRLRPEQVHVIAPDVGGAFGGKASICAEDVAVAFAAWHLRQPVKWIAQRSEDFLSAAQGRGAHMLGRLALARDGRMLGLEATLLFPQGWWIPFSGLVPAWNAGRILPGPYDIPAVHAEIETVLTNSPPIGIYRGAGRPESTTLLETLVHKAACALKMSASALRRLNLHSPGSLPSRLPSGALLDSGDYPAILTMTEELPGNVMQRPVSDAAVLRGRGEALFVEPCGQGWESARLTLLADGSVQLATGSSAQGQGRETAYAQIAAAALNRREEDIAVVHGDTERAPPGIGALASRSTAIGGSAVLKCAERFCENLRETAAAHLNCQPDLVMLGPEGVHDSRNPDNSLGWDALASRADKPVMVKTDYHVDHEAWSYGCCIADVEIDRETGVLRVTDLVFCDDSGRAINPMLIEGQIHGGIAQGLGEACLEAVITDEDGQLLSGSLMDYALPRADDMPMITTAKMEIPSLFNKLGARGVGEAGTIGTPPAILNAVRDALSELMSDEAIGDLEMPLTSEKLWRIMSRGPGQPGTNGSATAHSDAEETA